MGHCNCRHLWCWLDNLLGCRVTFVCVRHDAYIRRAFDGID